MPLHPNARAYLEAVLAQHRALQAYVDTGMSRPLSPRRPGVCRFETRYLEPGLFRFAFERPHPHPRLKHRVSRSVVGHDGDSAYLHTQHVGLPATLSRPGSLDLAVAMATGISSGTAHTIGALLFAEIGGWGLLDLRRLRFRRHRIVAGVRCICISGIHPRGGRVSAWFGAEDMLLRRLLDNRAGSEELRVIPQRMPALTPADFVAPAAAPAPAFTPAATAPGP
jgi:hypothetical protein